MPIKIENKKDCTGCNACYNICPKNCIIMENDDCWFQYPKVDETKCINCDLCIKVCPIKNSCVSSEGNPEVYAAWSNDPDIRYKSTSGGVFTELAKVILYQGGYIVGAIYTSDNMVTHGIISLVDDMDKVRQSKYIQSEIGEVYSRIKKLLDKDHTVLFCGTPCQVAGLKNYLQKQYDSLITVDFICRGVNSPKAYRYWLDEVEKLNGSKATRVWFKYKENGWKKSPYCTRVDFFNGKHIVTSGEENKFMMGYLQGNLYMRPSCSDCQFKGAKRSSDITLGDFWKVTGELDDDKGTSMVLINSDKGKKLFEVTNPKLSVHRREFEEIATGNVCFDSSVVINPKSVEFLEKLGTVPFSKLVGKYTNKHFIKKTIQRVVYFIKRLMK